MNLQLSWDLFILVFFAIVTAYSFIIGRNQTLKVILGSYIAILCADGLGNIFAKYFATSPTFLKILKLFTIVGDEQAVVVFKILVLVVLVVMVAVRGLFHVEADDDRPASVRIVILICLGVLSAGLLLSAVLVFASGGSLISNGLQPGSALANVYNSSRLIRIMLDYANVWFFLPGLTFIGLSLIQKKS